MTTISPLRFAGRTEYRQENPESAERVRKATMLATFNFLVSTSGNLRTSSVGNRDIDTWVIETQGEREQQADAWLREELADLYVSPEQSCKSNTSADPEQSRQTSGSGWLKRILRFLHLQA